MLLAPFKNRIPAGVKGLDAVLTEYVALKDADERRRSAVRNNPVAAKIRLPGRVRRRRRSHGTLRRVRGRVGPAATRPDRPRAAPVDADDDTRRSWTPGGFRAHASSRSESAQEKTRRRGAASKPRARGTDGRAYRRADGVRFAAGRGRGRRRRARKPGRRRRVAAVQPPARTRRRSRAEQTRRAHRGQHEHEPIHRARGVAERWKGLRGRRRRGFDPAASAAPANASIDVDQVVASLFADGGADDELAHLLAPLLNPQTANGTGNGNGGTPGSSRGRGARTPEPSPLGSTGKRAVEGSPRDAARPGSNPRGASTDGKRRRKSARVDTSAGVGDGFDDPPGVGGRSEGAVGGGALPPELRGMDLRRPPARDSRVIRVIHG